jgi:hypothetical protein
MGRNRRLSIYKVVAPEEEEEEEEDEEEEYFWSCIKEELFVFAR